MEAANDNVPRLRKMISEKSVLEIVPVSRSTLNRWVDAGLFPKATQLGPKRFAWFEDEVAEWQANPAKWQTKPRAA